MRNRCFRLLPLLLLAIATVSFAQSLGDVARQSRADREHVAVQPHVYTNDDLSSEPPPAAPEEADASKAEADSANTSADQSKESGDQPKTEGKAAAAVGTKSIKADSEKKEDETDKRSQEIDKRYTDRIDSLRESIVNAQKEMARLERDQIESTNQFRSTEETRPSQPEYARQQTELTGQIQAQREQIKNLFSQLEDAMEAARHAGVRLKD